MSAILFSVNGMDNIFRDLNKLSENIKTEVAAEMNASALNILTTAKKNCTVDNSTLRTSIQLIEQQTKEKLIYTVGSKLKYAPYVEFGTGKGFGIPTYKYGLTKNRINSYAEQFRGEGIKKPNMPYRPFFFKAFDKYFAKMYNNMRKYK